MDAMQKLNKICKQIANLSEAELKEIEDISRAQMNYIHPLKHATAERINVIGRHNRHVLAALRRLRNTIKKQ